VQTVKPATLPAAFPGTVIELPEANHLLKHEARPKADLNGASALSAYGDDTPLGDLAPLVPWLKGLK